jgi:Putative peptidoglycan binding domain
MGNLYAVSMSVNYRSLVPGGFYSATPFDRSIPVSIRCNNPGAVNGARWEKNYPGYVDTVETTPGNKTTIFEAPEFGVAVWWELLRQYAAAGAETVGAIITRYGGGQDYSKYIGFVTKMTGFGQTKKVPLDDDDTLLAFGKAMFHYEANRATPLKDEQIRYGLRLGRAKGKEDVAGSPPAVMLTEARTATDAPAPVIPPTTKNADALTLETYEGVKAIQSVLINLGYLDAPADGGYGPVTKWALAAFARQAAVAFSENFTAAVKKKLLAAQPLPIAPGKDLAGKIVRAMQANNYWIARHPDCRNIVYVEGLNPDGSLNDNRNNVFNDLRIVLRVKSDGVPEILGKWDATTEPSRKWTLQPMNPAGAFHIKFGQYKAWIKGWYHTHDALLQAGEIEGYRDPNKTFKRDFNYPVRGSDFGVHHHWGYDLPHDDMGNSSAGCLVGRSTQGHREFMALVLDDPRYKANPTYRFIAAVMPAGDLQPND